MVGAEAVLVSVFFLESKLCSRHPGQCKRLVNCSKGERLCVDQRPCCVYVAHRPHPSSENAATQRRRHGCVGGAVRSGF